jgi:hypothetical protein
MEWELLIFQGNTAKPIQQLEEQQEGNVSLLWKTANRVQ